MSAFAIIQSNDISRLKLCNGYKLATFELSSSYRKCIHIYIFKRKNFYFWTLL